MKLMSGKDELVDVLQRINDLMGIYGDHYLENTDCSETIEQRGTLFYTIKRMNEDLIQEVESGAFE